MVSTTIIYRPPYIILVHALAYVRIMPIGIRNIRHGPNGTQAQCEGEIIDVKQSSNTARATLNIYCIRKDLDSLYAGTLHLRILLGIIALLLQNWEN